MLVKAIRAILKKIFSICFPLRNLILFESIPDLSDNTKAVFDEMISRGMNNKYKMVWWVDDEKKGRQNLKNVIYMNPSKHKMRWELYKWQAKCLVSCNRFLVSKRKEQVSVYLSHGTPIKSVKKYYNIPERIQYSIAASESVRGLYAYEFNTDAERVYGLGYPRNDELVTFKTDIKSYLGTACEKIIVWYPTYRQHKKSEMKVEVNALPIIHNAESAIAVNECAKRNNILIVLKPHFAQDVSNIRNLSLSNIRFIDDAFFQNNGITSYQFVGNCDALITDYSSIYYDFTLCDKPIAFVWEDIEEYKKNPGLIDDYEYYSKGAEKIYTVEDFKAFVDRVGAGIDVLKTERNEIKDLTNHPESQQNAKRVVDFIVEKTKNKAT